MGTREITIKTVANGYLVTVIKDGNQSLYDQEQVFIAKSVAEIQGIIIRELPADGRTKS